MDNEIPGELPDEVPDNTQENNLAQEMEDAEKAKAKTAKDEFNAQAQPPLASAYDNEWQNKLQEARSPDSGKTSGLDPDTEKLLLNYLAAGDLSTLDVSSLKSFQDIESFHLEYINKRRKKADKEAYEFEHEKLWKERAKLPNVIKDKKVVMKMKNGDEIIYNPEDQAGGTCVTSPNISMETAPAMVALAKTQKWDPMYLTGTPEQKSILWLAIKRQNNADQLNYEEAVKRDIIDLPSEEERFEEAAKSNYKLKAMGFDEAKKQNKIPTTFQPITIGDFEDHEVLPKYREMYEADCLEHKKNLDNIRNGSPTINNNAPATPAISTNTPNTPKISTENKVDPTPSLNTEETVVKDLAVRPSEVTVVNEELPTHEINREDLTVTEHKINPDPKFIHQEQLPPGSPTEQKTLPEPEAKKLEARDKPKEIEAETAPKHLPAIPTPKGPGM